MMVTRDVHILQSGWWSIVMYTCCNVFMDVSACVVVNLDGNLDGTIVVE
jgi:hypothetical protein